MNQEIEDVLDLAIKISRKYADLIGENKFILSAGLLKIECSVTLDNPVALLLRDDKEHKEYFACNFSDKSNRRISDLIGLGISEIENSLIEFSDILHFMEQPCCLDAVNMILWGKYLRKEPNLWILFNFERETSIPSCIWCDQTMPDFSKNICEMKSSESRFQAIINYE